MMARRLVIVVLACTVVCSLLAAIPSEHAASRSRQGTAVASNYLLFQPDVYPERLAKNVVPFRIDAPNFENDDYVVTSHDDVELYVERVAQLTNDRYEYGRIKSDRRILFDFTSYKQLRVDLPELPRRTIGELKSAIEKQYELIEASSSAKHRLLLSVGLLVEGQHHFSLPGSYPLRDDDTVVAKFAVGFNCHAVAVAPNQRSSLTESLMRIRLPAVAFDRDDYPPNVLNDKWEKVQIFGSGLQPFDIDLTARPFVPDKSTWADLAGMLEKNKGEYYLRARLIPRLTSFAMPGDTIQFVRIFKEGYTSARLAQLREQSAKENDSSSEPKEELDSEQLVREPRVSQHMLTVDSDGFVWLPPVTTSAKLSYDALDMEWRRFSQIDGAFFRIRVAFPTGYLGDRFSVEEIAEALSCRGKNCGGTLLALPCVDSNCDAHVFANVRPEQTELSDLRYHLQLTGLTWTFVDSRGGRFSQAFQRGTLLDVATKDCILRLTGDTVDYDFDSVRVLVVPDANRNPTANRTPFFAEFGPETADNSFGIVILPGDVVFLQP